MTENVPVPDTLSTLTQLPVRKDGWDPRQRRPRSNIPGVRANTLPEVMPGEKVFRINPDSDVGRATLRRWGRRHGYTVKERGKIPAEVRAAFMKENDIWTVKIVSALLPGAAEPMQFFEVKQGSYVRKRTIDPFYVKRVLGDELYPLLQLVTP